MKLLQIILLYYLTYGYHCINGSSDVFTIQWDEKPNTKSYAMWENEIAEDLTSFTLCYRIKIFFYRPEVTVFSFIGSHNIKIRTDHNRRGMQILVARHSLRVTTTIVTPLLYWSSFCFGFDVPNKIYTVVFNGDIWKNGSIKFEPEDDIIMDKGGVIVLGQDQDMKRGGFDATQSFCGQITDLNFWSTLLPNDMLVKITNCEDKFHGDIIDWENSNWKLSGTQKENYLLSRTCKVNPSPYFLFEDLLQFDLSSKLCQAFGGELATPLDESQQEIMYNLAIKEGEVCTEDGGSLIWIGINDNDKEGTWVNKNEKSEIGFKNWIEGQPNGQTTENCAVMKGDHFNGSWADIPCSKSFKVCFVCKLDIPVFIRFRGICDANLYDDRYILKGKKNRNPYFRGYYRSHVYYNGTHWKLENVMNNKTFALMEESGSFTFPIGRNNWIFNHGFCGKPSNSLHSMTLTQCEKDIEFTCDDGSCIHINQVCDRRTQCPDKSDELDCSTILPPLGYQPTLPPPFIDNDRPLPVYLNLSISSINNIEAVQGMFTVELVVRMIWKDLRLKFKHLRRDRQLNIILSEEASNIWVPVVDFLNTRYNRHTLVDDDCKITIKRLGLAVGDNIESSKEARVYEGKDNYIRINRKYTIPFTCTFNFFNYPFNTDYCSLIFRINKNTDTYVALNMFGPGIRYEGLSQLIEYRIGKLKMERYVTDEPYSGLVAKIQMRHMFATELVTIYLPTTLLNLIGFASFFYKWFDFQNRIMVTLTSLLVMTTLFAQTSDTLPKTSYIKMLDIWFLFSMLFCFFIIFIHTMIEFSHKYGNPSECAGLQSIHDKSTTDEIPTNVLQIKVRPIKRMFAAESKKDPYKKSKNINRYGFIISSFTYVSFLLIFWIVTFHEQERQDTWDIPPTDELPEAYPE